MQDLSCTDSIGGIDEVIVVGVAQALTPHGESGSIARSTSGRGVQDLSCTDSAAHILDSTLERGVQDLSCTDSIGGIGGIDEVIVVGVAQALAPHGELGSIVRSTSGRGV